MKEESRIEALEHELKILKNEIHATLLEIREQILNHYYPELRAEEPLRNLSLPVRPAVGRPGVPTKNTPRTAETTTLSEIEAKGHIQPFSDIFLEDLSDDDDELNSNELVNSRRPNETDADDELDDELENDEEPEMSNSFEEGPVRKVIAAPRNNFGITPQTREVDFRQLKQQAAAATAKPKPAPTATPTPQAGAPAAKASRTNFAALATWVSDGVSKVGKEQTTQVVETFATGGKLSKEMQVSLMQMIAQAEDSEPAAPAGTQAMLGLMVGLEKILAQ
jgi:hypothetical protein